MHDCPSCGYACDCDCEDLWNDAAAEECACDCDDDPGEVDGFDDFDLDDDSDGDSLPSTNTGYWLRRRVWYWSRHGIDTACDDRLVRYSMAQLDDRDCANPACPRCRQARRVRLGERVKWRRLVASTPVDPAAECDGIPF